MRQIFLIKINIVKIRFLLGETRRNFLAYLRSSSDPLSCSRQKGALQLEFQISGKGGVGPVRKHLFFMYLLKYQCSLTIVDIKFYDTFS